MSETSATLAMDLSPEAFEERIRDSRSAQTATAYGRAARKFLVFLGENPPTGVTSFSSLPQNTLEQFVRWMVREQNLSPATVRLMAIGAAAYANFRRREGEEVPQFHAPALPQGESVPPRVLSEAELEAFLDAALEVPSPTGTLLVLLAATGLRSEEAVRLKLSDVRVEQDPDEELAWVVLSVLGKGRKRREVPMLLEANVVLAGYLDEWRAHKDAGDWLFPGTKKRHIQTRTVRNHLEKLRDGIPIPGLTAHVLRHTYATRLASSDVSPFAVMQLLGHEKPKGGVSPVTARNYVYLSLDDLFRELKKVRIPLEAQ